MFDLMLLIFLAPIFIIARLWRVFSDKDFPLNGLGWIIFGVPFGAIVWGFVIYEVICHIRIGVV